MKIILILEEGAHTFGRGHVEAVAAADVVIGADGEVIKNRNAPAGHRIDLEKLFKLIATKPRHRKAPGAAE